MPTVITHAIVGSSLGLFSPREVPVIRLVIVLAILPVLPDLDVVAFKLDIAYSHPLGHRGFSHSILFALIVASIVPPTLFRSVAFTSKAWWAIFILSFLSIISHGILDAFTNAGLGVGFFIPFDNNRYFFPWRPIATSPLSISAFFNGPALRILGSELFWVGIPLAGSVLTVAAIKRIFRNDT